MTIPRLVGSLSPAAAQAGATELLVLLPSLGTSSAMWDGVVSRLRPTHQNLRVLSVDLPGHGVSPVARHPFSISELAAAVLQLVDDVGGGSFWVAGVSLGGVIALELALQAPQRVRGFAMFSSGSSIGTAEGWAARVEQVRRSGTASLVTASAERWFAEGFLANDPHQAGAAQLSKLVDVDDESYALDV
ncbi:MAG: alpha/beta fold hydrolase, partial [Pseudolysinimonas sp.]